MAKKVIISLVAFTLLAFALHFCISGLKLYVKPIWGRDNATYLRSNLYKGRIHETNKAMDDKEVTDGFVVLYQQHERLPKE